MTLRIEPTQSEALQALTPTVPAGASFGAADEIRRAAASTTRQQEFIAQRTTHLYPNLVKSLAAGHLVYD